MLAGPWEFVPRGKEPSEEIPDLAAKLDTAFSSMPYDVLFVLPEEKAWLEANGQTLPASAVVLEGGPKVKTFTLNGIPLAVIGCPPMDNTDMGKMELFDLVAKKAEALGKDNELVIGVSPWGLDMEQLFLDNYPKALDILLGSGNGSSMAGLTATEKTYWARSYRRGKSLSNLRVMDLPSDPEAKVPGRVTVVGAVTSLSNKIPDTPEIAALFPVVEETKK